jgi:hypothetical protein
MARFEGPSVELMSTNTPANKREFMASILYESFIRTLIVTSDSVGIRTQTNSTVTL